MTAAATAAKAEITDSNTVNLLLFFKFEHLHSGISFTRLLLCSSYSTFQKKSSLKGTGRKINYTEKAGHKCPALHFSQIKNQPAALSLRAKVLFFLAAEFFFRIPLDTA